MKISIDVDLTPEEARRFFGLPDVKPLQDEIVERMRERMGTGAEGLDPAAIVPPLVSSNMAAYEAIQKAFWSALAASGDKTAKSD